MSGKKKFSGFKKDPPIILFLLGKNSVRKKTPLLSYFLLRKNSVRKQTPYYPIFAKEKLRKKKLKNQELEFAEGFRRIKNIKENNFKILHKELKKTPEKLSILKQNLTSSITRISTKSRLRRCPGRPIFVNFCESFPAKGVWNYHFKALKGPFLTQDPSSHIVHSGS